MLGTAGGIKKSPANQNINHRIFLVGSNNLVRYWNCIKIVKLIATTLQVSTSCVSTNIIPSDNESLKTCIEFTPEPHHEIIYYAEIDKLSRCGVKQFRTKNMSDL